MRHKVNTKKLNRNIKQRQALFKTQLEQVIDNERLTTTQAKALLIKRALERLINQAKKSTVASHRLINARLFSRTAAHKLIHVIAPRYQSSSGGYLTATRLRKRRGDNALLIKLQLKKMEEKSEPKTEAKVE